MKSPNIADLQPNEIYTGVFLVQHKEIRQKKSGDPYLSLILVDRTGEVDARMFDNAADALDTFERGNFVRVKGLLQIFQNRPQLTIHKIVPVPDSEVDFADFFPASTRDRDEMFAELRAWISSITHPHLKALLEAMFADEEIALAFRTAPAAKTVHHAWLGGLLEHVLSLCHLAKFAAAHYPNIDFDLLLAGVILHDIGKTRELSYARGFVYSTEGQLIGHIVIGVRLIEEKLRGLPDFPAPLRDLVLHMMLSHHGELEFGSPKVPMFPEAMLLHYLDNMDSKLECARALLVKDKMVEGVWTAYSPPLDRTVLKRHKYLAGGDSAPAPHPASKPAPHPAAEPARKSDSPFAEKLQQALGHDR